MKNDLHIKVNNTLYPYTIESHDGIEYLLIRLEVGKYPNGRKRYKCIYAHSEEQLADKLQDALNDLIVVGSNITIRQLALATLAEKRKVVSTATYDRLESVVNVHIIHDLGDKRIDYMSFQNIQRYLELKAEKGHTRTGRNMSKSSIQKLISFFHAMGRYGYLNEYFDHDPMLELKMPATATKEKEKRIMNSEELIAFLNALDTKDKDGNYIYVYRNAILFMLHTGLRATEVFALKKDKVNLQQCCIEVSRDRVKVRNRTSGGEKREGYQTVIVEQTKNASSKRLVPLDDVAYEVVADAMRKSTSDLVFPNANGTVVNPCPFSHSFNKICKRAGVNITPHALRHTFATLVIDNTDLKIEELAKIMGHSSTRVTYDTYVHQQPHKQADLGKRINSLLD